MKLVPLRRRTTGLLRGDDLEGTRMRRRWEYLTVLQVNGTCIPAHSNTAPRPQLMQHKYTRVDIRLLSTEGCGVTYLIALCAR